MTEKWLECEVELLADAEGNEAISITCTPELARRLLALCELERGLEEFALTLGVVLSAGGAATIQPDHI